MDEVVRHARLVVIRLLGGTGWYRYLVEDRAGRSAGESTDFAGPSADPG